MDSYAIWMSGEEEEQMEEKEQAEWEEEVEEEEEGQATNTGSSQHSIRGRRSSQMDWLCNISGKQSISL